MSTTDNSQNQPPLSPPLTARKPATRSNGIHAFFTPRHRAPLGEVSTTDSVLNPPSGEAGRAEGVDGGGSGSGSGVMVTPSSTAGPLASLKNIHLLSPEDSPSNRLSKKARRGLFPPSAGQEREPFFAMPMELGVKGKKLFPDSGVVVKGKGKSTGGIFDEAKEEEAVEKPVAKERLEKLRPTGRSRVLMRMLGTSSMTGIRSVGPHHCANWKYEVEGFYSRPEDSHMIIGPDQKPALPFTAKACHQNSLVAIGDESGVVRLIETDINEEEVHPFNKLYLGILCHDNAVFDLSWSPDDHQIATASGDQSARVFDVVTQVCTNVLAGHRSSVKQVAFSPRNPSILTTCARDGNIHFFDTRCVGTASSLGKNIVENRPVNSILQAHAETGPKKGVTARSDISVTAAAWLINRDNVIATACESNSCIKIWDIRSIQTRRKVASAVEMSATPPHHQPPKHRPFGLNCLSLSLDGSRMYAMCRDSVIYAYSTSHVSNGPIHAYSHPRLHASTFYVKTSVSQDGRLLGAGSSDGIAVIFPTDERYLDQHSYRLGKVHPDDSTPTPASPPSSLTPKPTVPSPPAASRKSPFPVAQHMKVGKGVGLIRGHAKEVTDVTWTVIGDLVAISDDFQARCWRNDNGDGKAEELRVQGSEQGRGWGCGWAERAC